jgi:transcriptional regulator with XRE-family HTH domain
LGAVVAGIRTRNGWTLKEMSTRTGIPVSTLSKVEHNRLSLSYDKLQQLAQRLNLSMADLFAEDASASPAPVLGRRSVGTLETAVRVNTENYDYFYVCTELKNKRMVPIITEIRATTVEEFGDLVRHSGEEFIYVLSGSLIVHTEFYDPIVLEQGESIYIDSGMGHAYLRPSNGPETWTLGVMSSAEEDLANMPFARHEHGCRSSTE